MSTYYWRVRYADGTVLSETEYRQSFLSIPPSGIVSLELYDTESKTKAVVKSAGEITPIFFRRHRLSFGPEGTSGMGFVTCIGYSGAEDSCYVFIAPDDTLTITDQLFPN